MSGGNLYWKFDDRNPAFKYGPGWSNLTDVNANGSTLSYTSEPTNVTIQFYGKTMWLFGAIGRTQDCNQPVSRYTLDNQYVSTITADVKNDTSYNELFAYFYNLDSSYHTLVVENIKEGATIFLDYYLVEPIPPDELMKSMGNLQTGGKPLSTSISENPILASAANLSTDAAAGSFVGAVVGGILLALAVAAVAFIIWRRKRGSKPYYYKPAAVHEVLFDELKLRTDVSKELPVAATITPYTSPATVPYDPPGSSQRSPPIRTRTVMSQSSIYSLGSGHSPISTSPRQIYFPMPSEYQSHNILPNSKPITRSRPSSFSEPLSRSHTKTLSHSSSASSTRLSGLPLSKEERPLL